MAPMTRADRGTGAGRSGSVLRALRAHRNAGFPASEFADCRVEHVFRAIRRFGEVRLPSGAGAVVQILARRPA
jgi:hypothetical protein